MAFSADFFCKTRKRGHLLTFNFTCLSNYFPFKTEYTYKGIFHSFIILLSHLIRVGKQLQSKRVNNLGEIILNFNT